MTPVEQFFAEFIAWIEAGGTFGVYAMLYMMLQVRKDQVKQRRWYRRLDRRILALEIHAGIQPMEEEEFDIEPD